MGLAQARTQAPDLLHGGAGSGGLGKQVTLSCSKRHWQVLPSSQSPGPCRGGGVSTGQHHASMRFRCADFRHGLSPWAKP